MGLDIKAPENVILKPIITVFGVGGAGGNAVNNMIKSGLKGANFVVANTDAQALTHSEALNKIQLGATSTKGLGAGASPEVGKKAALESESEIRSYLEGSNMLFITAGMGGGTGTGASPVIAKIARELGILTVGVVTKPFLFEGSRRMRVAEKGLADLQKEVDTLIVIPNQNLFRIANENTTFQEAFEMADEVLHAGVRGVTDLITSPGLVNLDFADIETVMGEKGKAMMGTGEASGEERAIKAAEQAIANPLLDQNSMCGASGVLINITGGKDMTLYEVDSAANRIREEIGDIDANIIFGSTFNPELDGIIRVSVVATGIEGTGLTHKNREEEEALEIAKNQQVTRQTQEDQAEGNLSGRNLAEGNPASEEFASGGVASVSVSDVQPPSYNEYDDKISEGEAELQKKLEQLARQMDWNKHQQISENPQSSAPSPAPLPRKPSLLRRMWNSLKAADSEAVPHAHTPNSEQAAMQNQADKTPEIQEIPRFRKE
ncbi:MAG: cell division protein FtsZ [Rickettsiales bacterium]|nr:MAG: cell division protein FtsZ [Rickettsiales bacterium]